MYSHWEINIKENAKHFKCCEGAYAPVVKIYTKKTLKIKTEWNGWIRMNINSKEKGPHTLKINSSFVVNATK